MRRLALGIVWRYILILVFCFAETAASTTLAQTQLRGVTGVYVYVTVARELEPQSAALKGLVKSKLEDEFVRAGLSLKAAHSETFYLDVKAVPVECKAGEKLFALLVRARLTEDVALKRDPELRLPESPATWSKESLVVSSGADLQRAIERSLEYFVSAFTDEWKIENPERVKESAAERARRVEGR